MSVKCEKLNLSAVCLEFIEEDSSDDGPKAVTVLCAFVSVTVCSEA